LRSTYKQNIQARLVAAYFLKGRHQSLLMSRGKASHARDGGAAATLRSVDIFYIKF